MAARQSGGSMEASPGGRPSPPDSTYWLSTASAAARMGAHQPLSAPPLPPPAGAACAELSCASAAMCAAAAAGCSRNAFTAC